MDAKVVKKMGRRLRKFITEFDDCFSRREPREHLRTYVAGQLSDLPRKSVEPIALSAGIPPRTLQRFLSDVLWDHERLRDKTQWIVARDHSHPHAIGIIDESGNPKKGKHTCGVKRQWCGNTGKIDNCVVGVHLAYAVGDFQCLLDSDLYLPREWVDNLVFRKATGIPEEVIFRKKVDIALRQVGRSLNNGVRFSALTADEFYGRDRDFLDGLERLGQDYVVEIPSDFTGWTNQPNILQKPTPSELRKRGRKRRFPRISRQTNHPCEVRNLAVHSPKFYTQKWKKYKIKDGEKGPVVWEVKAATFYRKHGQNGLPGREHTLVVARNVLNTDEVKYFLSNMTIGSGETTLSNLLWIAFSRWPVERCFEIGKRDLGMDHFETRSWQGIHRHFYISQLSQLFCARVQHDLREKNFGESLFDGRTSSAGHINVAYRPSPALFGSQETLSESCRSNRLSPKTQLRSSEISYANNLETIAKQRYKYQTVKDVYAT
jgi:SRSO17 transposase